MIDDEALQVFFSSVLLVALDTQSLNTSLTLRAIMPTNLWTFVTTYVDVFRWEEFNDFTQYIFNEFQSCIVTGTKHFFRHTPLTPYFVRTTSTTEFRISIQSTHHMTWHINFRNDNNVLVSSIRNDFLNFFLSIETTIRLTIVFARITANHSFCSLRTLFCQQRTTLDFNSPTLVICQVPVETVDVMQSQHIDETLDFVCIEEMTRNIQHSTTIREAWSIVDFYCRQ